MRSRGRRPIFERGSPCSQTKSEFTPTPSRGIEELSAGYQCSAAESPTPTPPLLHRSEKGEGLRRTAIDLGCGAGRDAFWLQQNGWEVLGVDRLPPQAPIPFVQANLHEFRTDEQFDLVLLHYCWDPEYFKLALGLCARGGFVSVIAHSEINWRCSGHPRWTKTMAKGQIATFSLRDFDIIIEEEFWSLDRHSVRVVLERHT